MPLKIGTDVGRRSRRYAARQRVADFETEPVQPPLPLTGSVRIRSVKEELAELRAKNQAPYWWDEFCRDE